MMNSLHRIHPSCATAILLAGLSVAALTASPQKAREWKMSDFGMIGECEGLLSWTRIFQSQQGKFKGYRMFSAPDVYRVSLFPNQIQDSLKRWLDGEGDDGYRRFIGPPRVVFNSGDRSARVIHNPHGGIATEVEVELTVKNIPLKAGPMYPPPLSLEEFNSGGGLRFVQALFRTSDDSAAILQTLKAVGHHQSISIRMPSQEELRHDIHTDMMVSFVRGEIAFVSANSGLTCGIDVRKVPLGLYHVSNTIRKPRETNSILSLK